MGLHRFALHACLLPLSLEVLRCNFCCRASLRLRFCGRGALLIRLSTCRVGSYAGACSATPGALFAIACPGLEMEEDDRSSSDRSPRSRAPRKASHHVQNAPERTNVACSGAALVCNRRLNQNRRGKATFAALSTRPWPRDVVGREARACSTRPKEAARAHSSTKRTAP